MSPTLQQPLHGGPFDKFAAMRTDATFRYGGALLIALVFALMLGFAATPTLGVIVGLAAGVAWLVIGLISQRGTRRT